MLEKLYFNEPNHTDLNLYRCGIEDCASGHSWGPGLRDHYIIHYVLKGKGVFQAGGITYPLQQQDGFLICPGTVVQYQADEKMPWSYAWVGFHGLKAESYLKQAGLGPEKPVFHYDRDDYLKNCLNRMVDARNLGKGREIRLLGILYEFLSQLVEVSALTQEPGSGDGRKEQYITKAVEFISKNYSRRIHVSEMSRHIGLDRSYLYLLFREFLSLSPQAFIIQYRMDKACELMGNADLSIGEVARSVGYDDPLLFSKVFKKVKGIVPREYRKSLGV